LEALSVLTTLAVLAVAPNTNPAISRKIYSVTACVAWSSFSYCSTVSSCVHGGGCWGGMFVSSALCSDLGFLLYIPHFKFVYVASPRCMPVAGMVAFPALPPGTQNIGSWLWAAKLQMISLILQALFWAAYVCAPQCTAVKMHWLRTALLLKLTPLVLTKRSDNRMKLTPIEQTKGGSMRGLLSSLECRKD